MLVHVGYLGLTSTSQGNTGQMKSQIIETSYDKTIQKRTYQALQVDQ